MPGPCTMVRGSHNSSSARKCRKVRALVRRPVAQVRCNWDWVRDCRMVRYKPGLEGEHYKSGELVQRKVLRRVRRWYR